MSESEHGIRAGGLRTGYELTEKNFVAWEAKMQRALDNFEALDLTLGTEARPGPPPAPTQRDGAITNQAQIDAVLKSIEKWDKSKRRACSMIMQSIQDDQAVNYIVEQDDPVELWKKIHEKYARISTAAGYAATENFMAFAHILEETADETVSRFNALRQAAYIRRWHRVMIRRDESYSLESTLSTNRS